jgi:hypothetical protein
MVEAEAKRKEASSYHRVKKQVGTVVIFCKSRNFLQETDETLKSHVAFVNSVFDVELQQVKNMRNMMWFVAKGSSDILYMVGHTGDAECLISSLHDLCACGIGTQIKDIYLNTCSSKPGDEVQNVGTSNFLSIVPLSEASEDEKKKLGISKNKFITLDNVLEKVKDDGFRIHICQQDTVTDYNVKMAHFLPMDECGLGFSPTKSELLLYNHRGTLSEKLTAAFEDACK